MKPLQNLELGEWNNFEQEIFYGSKSIMADKKSYWGWKSRAKKPFLFKISLSTWLKPFKKVSTKPNVQSIWCGVVSRIWLGNFKSITLIYHGLSTIQGVTSSR